MCSLEVKLVQTKYISHIILISLFHTSQPTSPSLNMQESLETNHEPHCCLSEMIFESVNSSKFHLKLNTVDPL